MEQAIEIYKKGEEKITGLLALFGSTDQLVERFEVKDEVAYAYQNGSEIVCVPVKEPKVVCEFYDAKNDVYRQSIT